MLDKLTASVLGIVNAESGGAYKVMETDDFIAALPAEGKTDAAGVANALQYLSERGYIDIRYSDRGTYCVCSLRRSRQAQTGGRGAVALALFARFFGRVYRRVCGGLFGVARLFLFFDLNRYKVC